MTLAESKRRPRHPRQGQTSALARAVAARQPTLAQALAEAIAALRAEQLEEAEQRLNAVLARWPEQADALHYLGVLRHTQGRHDDAVALIQRAIALMPAAPGPWNNLGNVLMVAQRIDEAQSAYERSVAVAGDDPGAADALNNLASIHRKHHRLDSAEASCRRALQLRPDFADAWYKLSQVLMAQGRIHDSLIANSRAIALWPSHLQGRDQVLRALLLLGERERAAQLYREWLAEEPDNPVVQHQLAACLGGVAPERASDAYVERVFDGFAESFDAKLESLNYRAPTLVVAALRNALGEPGAALDIVDLGCGTGLCGPELRPWARQLVGCDLSLGMLRRAKQRAVYDTLHKAELVHYLGTQPEHFDAAISADTLCYFGDLRAALQAAARALRPSGCLIFTVEALADDDTEPHRLQTNGRYAHHARHLRSALAAACLQLHELSAHTLRLEAGKPVPGWLVRANKP